MCTEGGSLRTVEREGRRSGATGAMGWPRASRRLAVALALSLVVVVELAGRCHGGVTSSFVRKTEKTVDMPLDSDVFRVPPGYNAPQQVFSWLPA